MPNIFSSNYLSRKPIELAMEDFAKNFDKDKKILDIGCGNKPYAKYFSCQYIGLDPFRETKADIIADAWNIPVSDNEFDGIILNQSLEHIAELEKTISEIERVLRPGGLCIVTVPQTMKNHSMPIPSEKIEMDNFDKNKIRFFNIDYYRFTKFGLIHLFKNFQITTLDETSGYFGTIFQLMNYFFASLNIKYIFIPIYTINNMLGMVFDFLFSVLNKSNVKIIKRFYEVIYQSLTLNYIMIAKKPTK